MFITLENYNKILSNIQAAPIKKISTRHAHYSNYYYFKYFRYESHLILIVLVLVLNCYFQIARIIKLYDVESSELFESTLMDYIIV